ncbi:MAG: hypothetical protein HGB08_01815 [Candidatus Moranbacteria bacterium]|nr:hypothetical protein [Candidatus Moranbacteria bacterium]
MYWIFLVLFITAVLVPDLIRGQVYFITEERAEEILIFVLGMIAFLTFINNERKIAHQKKEKEKAEKKIDQTVKDLVDSYSYIGEVNRKMDILMGVALGLSDRSALDRKKENEIYLSILNAATFLLKAESVMLRFVNIKTGRTEKEIKLPETGKMTVSNKVLVGIEENMNLKKQNDSIIISSSQKISDIKSFLVAHDYDENEENKPKNIEILKLFASQAIFLHSYMSKSDK